MVQSLRSPWLNSGRPYRTQGSGFAQGIDLNDFFKGNLLRIQQNEPLDYENKWRQGGLQCQEKQK